LDEDQFGFRTGRGTREVMLTLRQILQRIEMDRKTYVAFIDLEKAFDKVNWQLLFENLKKSGIDWREKIYSYFI